MQNVLVEEIENQPFGAYFGFQCDEVTYASNWEQLGIVLRNTVNGVAVERLLEFIPAKEITGEALCCDLFITSLTNVGLDIQYCRAPTGREICRAKILDVLHCLHDNRLRLFTTTVLAIA